MVGEGVRPGAGGDLGAQGSAVPRGVGVRASLSPCLEGVLTPVSVSAAMQSLTDKGQSL